METSYQNIKGYSISQFEWIYPRATFQKVCGRSFKLDLLDKNFQSELTWLKFMYKNRKKCNFNAKFYSTSFLIYFILIKIFNCKIQFKNRLLRQTWHVA